MGDYYHSISGVLGYRQAPQGRVRRFQPEQFQR